jgi:hypothetical protein
VRDIPAERKYLIVIVRLVNKNPMNEQLEYRLWVYFVEKLRELLSPPAI